MGLDQYAYVTGQKGDRDRFYESGEYVDGQLVNSAVPQPRELAYWRKHPNLQGWMERLWLKKLGIPSNASDQFIEDKIPESFNGVELELTWEDIDQLEKDLVNGVVAGLETTGFFFGDASDYHYREHDLEFCRNAKAELFCGLRVFYNSSW